VKKGIMKKSFEDLLVLEIIPKEVSEQLINDVIEVSKMLQGLSDSLK
jgi:hypothetical protein